MSEIKCKCGLNNKTYCPRCSKVRMVILLKNGHENLKLTRANGDQYNPVWYSFLKYNKYEVYRIAEKWRPILESTLSFAQLRTSFSSTLTGRDRPTSKKQHYELHKSKN